MTLDEIIDSFKLRVNRLSQDWDTLTTNELTLPQDQLELLKTKLDLVQEQNSTIIVDLDHIKKVLNLDDDASNNVFTLLSTTGDSLHEESINLKNMTDPNNNHASPNTPQSEVSSTFNIQSNALNPHDVPPDLDVASISTLTESLDHEITNSLKRTKHNENDDELDIEEFKSPKKRKKKGIYFHGPLSAAKPNGNFTRRPIPQHHLQEIEDYHLKMIDCPKSVYELYNEFHKSLKLQILEFEKRFGTGQMSKIPKIRTYQRRKALVSEIDRYSRFSNKPTDEAIQFFESIRLAKGKTVAWLYNNLGRILEEYNII